MAELFEEVVGVLESRPSTRSLAGQFRINSEKTAGNGAVLGVPVFIADLCRWSADPTQSISLLKVLRTIDTGALSDMGRTIESRRYEPVGSDVTDMLLGTRRMQVASVISGEAGISERSANALLPAAAWALMASIADRYGSRIDRQSLLAILTKEQNDLVSAGWGPWLEATGEKDHAPVVRPIRRAEERVRLPEAAEASYPLPVSRHARPAGEQATQLRAPSEQKSFVTAGAPRSSGAPRPSGGGSSSVATAVSVTGQIDRSDLDLGFDFGDPAFLDTPLPEPERSPVPAILAALLLLGLIGVGVYWFFLRDTATEQSASDIALEGPIEADEDTLSDTDDTGQLTAQSLDPVALDLAMRDPEALSAATGIAELRFDPDAGEVCYNITAQNISSPFDGFINVGPAGVKGAVLVDFGPLENAAIGCTAIGPIEMAAIVADPAGHYVEVIDQTGAVAIRAQLSDVVDGSLSTTGEVIFDPAGDGAGSVVEPGQLMLSGEVADQATYDLLSTEYRDLEAQGLEVINDLTISPEAPPPSGQITVASEGLFAISSSQLSEGGQESVATMVQILNARPEWSVTIIGHTDSTGDEDLNRQLSLARADAVRAALLAAGVSDAGIQTSGVGSSDPVADNSTEEGRALNRRIEFQIKR